MTTPLTSVTVPFVGCVTALTVKVSPSRSVSLDNTSITVPVLSSSTEKLSACADGKVFVLITGVINSAFGIADESNDVSKPAVTVTCSKFAFITGEVDEPWLALPPAAVASKIGVAVGSTPSAIRFCKSFSSKLSKFCVGSTPSSICC